MIEVDQSDYRVGSDTDLYTCGLGPCVGVVVGYEGRVSILHAPMPDAGGAEDFFVELCDEIPQQDRAAIRPILAGALINFGRSSREIFATRNWVEAQFKELGFGLPHVH